MRGRNPSVGRHAIGAPLAKSGTKPPSRTGSASGSFVGTGVNKKSGQRPEYGASTTKPNDNRQAEQLMQRPPEPFANSQQSANPRSYQTGPSAKVGGMGGKTGVAGPMTGSAGIGSGPTSNFPAASTGGGLGQEKGKVVGKAQPKRVGNAYDVPRGSSAGGFKGRGGAPSFYGR